MEIKKPYAGIKLETSINRLKALMKDGEKYSYRVFKSGSGRCFFVIYDGEKEPITRIWENWSSENPIGYGNIARELEKLNIEHILTK